MSILDLFKSRWSSIDLGDDDRKRIFWYLKRKTSLTAWKAYSDSFDIFAGIFERQAQEEPHVRRGTLSDEWGTNWERHWLNVLKGRVLFEDGLSRLSNGDRTVWLCNDRGVLQEATSISERWYSDLVNHGMQGDKYFEGKYVNELTDALRAMSVFAEATAEVLQPRMANTPAPDFFYRGWLHDTQKHVQFPTYLPDVPLPKSDLRIRTGDVVPLFGIYEPLIPDGCMNYLLAGVPAPEMWIFSEMDEEPHERPVTWKLVWEDDRYQDGVIPAEERSYFVAQAATLPTSAPHAADLLSAFSGEPSPKAGVWAVADNIAARSFFNEGEKLPTYANRDVTWVWVANAT